MKIEQNALEIQEHVLLELRRIARSLGVYSKQLQKSGLTSSQLAVLRTLAAQGPMPANHLSRAVELSQGTVTSVLDRLVSKSLIQRNRREGDRRQVWVTLTDIGLEAFQGAPSPMHLEFLDSFSQLQDWEQTMILSSLQRVAGMMDIGPANTQKQSAAIADNIEKNLDLLFGEHEDKGC
ncbi:MAG: MarR family winged helix-turn-helix transcriptional regulator [Methylobacter sp.]